MSGGLLLSPWTMPVMSYKGLKANSDASRFTKSSTLVHGRSRGYSSFKVCCMKTWDPMDNKRFETLSYVKQPLSDESIAKQVEYTLSKGWVPGLEFDEAGYLRRENSRMPGYYDGRYWTLWKLPMFGCQDASEILAEFHECKKTYPNAFIRYIAFDSSHQCQSMAFLIHKPEQAT